MTRDPEWTPTYQRALGRELIHARKMGGLTRRDLRRRLKMDISLQTIATYELGTRSIPHVRLVHIAMTLEVNLPKMLDRVYKQVFAAADQLPAGCTLDLVAVSELDDPLLAPLRRWARSQRDNSTDPHGPPKSVRIDLHTLDALSRLCDLDMMDLARRLTQPELARAV